MIGTKGEMDLYRRYARLSIEESKSLYQSVPFNSLLPLFHLLKRERIYPYLMYCHTQIDYAILSWLHYMRSIYSRCTLQQVAVAEHLRSLFTQQLRCNKACIIPVIDHNRASFGYLYIHMICLRSYRTIWCNGSSINR